MRQLHQDQPVFTAGEPLGTARAAMVMLHGRGASAQDILSLSTEFTCPGLAFLAPQAASAQWYPNRFTAPLASNEPWFSSAMAFISDLLTQVYDAGIAPKFTFLLGFSQGACLGLEYAARHPRRYGGVFGLSGALIENGDQPREYTGSFDSAPVFLGCSDVDYHIPLERVLRSAQIFRKLGAEVTERIYPGMAHTINHDEIAWINKLLEDLQTK